METEMVELYKEQLKLMDHKQMKIGWKLHEAQSAVKGLFLDNYPSKILPYKNFMIDIMNSKSIDAADAYIEIMQLESVEIDPTTKLMFTAALAEILMS